MKLQDHLTEYAEPQEQHEFQIGTELNADGATTQQKHGWHGLRAVSNDGQFIAQFTRNGFVFSRLKPYEDWERFEAEALRLWNAFAEVAQPTEIDRLGVRFINVMELEPGETPGDILSLPPQVPDSLPLQVSEFMHQTQFDIPQYGYQLNVIQTVQRSDGKASVILDLDVSTTIAPAAPDGNLSTRLREMQWIKNKAFFSLVSQSAIARFQE